MKRGHPRLRLETPIDRNRRFVLPGDLREWRTTRNRILLLSSLTGVVQPPELCLSVLRVGAYL
jgi:hypothetical protein